MEKRVFVMFEKLSTYQGLQLEKGYSLFKIDYDQVFGCCMYKNILLISQPKS